MPPDVRRRSPWRLAPLLVALGVAFAMPAGSQPGDVVYHATEHGDATSGVDRDPVHSPGACVQCHASRSLPASPFEKGLFAANDNALCLTCHGGAGVAGPWLGTTVWSLASHAISSATLWPGPVPAARRAGDERFCLNCHTPHGLRDAGGLVPTLGVAREEALCVACHDANGPASTDVAAQLGTLAAHPVMTVAGVHDPGEGLVASEFGLGLRHAECADCHNPHAAGGGAALSGVTRIGVSNGAALTVPTWLPRDAADPTPVLEYEVCFKCHSSWSTRPAGAHDQAFDLNPANASFHPIEAAGTNTTSAMTVSLAGGSGTPDLVTSSIITCSDCHGSDTLPTTVTRVSSYTGATATGPHGSNAGAVAAFSNAILRAAYRTTLKGRFDAYAASDFTLCFVCHEDAPFSSGGDGSRSDTNFRFHAKHSSRIDDQGSFDGDILTPGSGRGNAVCKECHYSLHGVAGAPNVGDRDNTRLVSFAPNITGPGGTGAPVWSPGSCRLRCHGQNHDTETY